MNLSIKDKVISGLAWSFLQNIGAKGTTFVVTIILARFLSPNEFGLIGMITIFILVSQALINGGFNQALIRQKENTEADFSSVFHINFITSLALYGILYFTAPLISKFYGEAELIALIRVLSIVFVISAFSYVQEARLVKGMEFKKLLMISLPASILGGGASIVMALLGLGVWSLVGLQIITRIVYVLQIWAYSSWKPKMIFDKKRSAKLFSYGGKLALSSIINTIYQNIYLVVIGKFFALSNVGYYQYANNLVVYPVNLFTTALNKVVFPAFSKIQDDDLRLKQGYKRIIKQIFFWVFPIFAIAGIIAVPLFRFFLNEKWVPAASYFQWLCVIGILFPVNAFNLNILNVKGRSDLFLKLEVLKKIIITIGIIFSIPFGIQALLMFQAANSFIAYILNSYYSGRFIKYPITEQIKDITSIIVLGTIVGGIVACLDYLLKGQPDLIRIIIGLFGGLGIYICSAKILKFSSLIDFENIVRAKFLKSSKNIPV